MKLTHRLLIVALSALVLAAGTTKQPAPEHVERTGPGSNAPVDAVMLEKRLEEGARDLLREYPQGASRIVAYDIVFPRGAEYAAVGANAVLVLTAVTRNEGELPLKSVYARTPNGDVPLQRVAMWQKPVQASSPVAEAYGTYRQYYVYLWPLASLPGDAALRCDFAINRSDFAIASRPAANRPPYSTQPGAPTVAALKAFIAREYPGVVPASAFAFSGLH